MTTDLSNYSYLLLYVDDGGNIFGNATGFLLKKSNSFFLVTNIHVLFGIHVNDLSPIKELIKYQNYKIYLRYTTNTGEIRLFDTGIDKKRELYYPKFFPKILDVISYELPSLPSNGLFYFINEDFKLDSEFKSINLNALGYPYEDYLVDYRERETRVLSGITIGDTTENGRRVNTDLLITPGMSGSPIFSIHIREKSTIVKFFGIGDGYDPETKTSFITRFYGSNAFRAYF